MTKTRLSQPRLLTRRFLTGLSYTSIKKQADEHRPVSSQLIERNSLFLAQLACSCFVQDDNNI